MKKLLTLALIFAGMLAGKAFAGSTYTWTYYQLQYDTSTGKATLGVVGDFVVYGSTKLHNRIAVLSSTGGLSIIGNATAVNGYFSGAITGQTQALSSWFKASSGSVTGEFRASTFTGYGGNITGVMATLLGGSSTYAGFEATEVSTLALFNKIDTVAVATGTIYSGVVSASSFTLQGNRVNISTIATMVNTVAQFATYGSQLRVGSSNNGSVTNPAFYYSGSAGSAGFYFDTSDPSFKIAVRSKNPFAVSNTSITVRDAVLFIGTRTTANPPVAVANYTILFSSFNVATGASELFLEDSLGNISPVNH